MNVRRDYIIIMERADVRESFEDEKARRFCELADFLAKWHNLPAQRTQQWYDDRTFSIGASEIATLLGEMTGKKINPYETVRTLVAGKVGLKKIGDKTAMNWGCILEKVVTMLTEQIFDCHIEEMGSVPTAGMHGQRSSPDGVAVVPCLGNKIVSFEFKAPKNRIPKGYVPAYYRPQVLTCLCAVEPSDLGIFVDCVIRRCSPEQWAFGSPEYDYEYHREIDLGMPQALAILYFYDAEPTAEIEKLTDALDSLDPADVDQAADGGAVKPHTGQQVNLGTCPPDVFDDHFARACAHTLRVEYSPIYMAHNGQPNWEAEIAKHPKAVAVLPIKILRCVVCPVVKEPGYILQFQPLVDKIIETVRVILNAPEDERAAAYERECNVRGWFGVPYGYNDR